MSSRVVVIGSGFGGLALAIRLQTAGFSVTILEQRDRPGGRAYVYEDAGYTFDAGPTVITDPTCLQELFQAGGRRLDEYVELLPVDPFYRLLWPDGARFDYANDQSEIDRQIGAISPKDVDGYRRFLAYSEQVFEVGYRGLGHVPFLDFRSMVRAAPDLIRLQGYRSVYAVVSRFIEHPYLRQALSFHTLLVGGNPYSTSAVYALIHALERRWGVYFPRGGTGALVRGLAKYFQDLGGVIRLNAPAERIETQGDRVTGVTTNGEFLAADVVVSNADVVHTYETLLGRHQRGRDEAQRLRKKQFSNSLFVIYFGLKGEYKDVAHHSILFGPRYRELLAEIFNGPNLAEDFSLYLHAPCATDPSLAPPGCSAFYVLSPVPHLDAAPIDWSTQGPIYRDRILAAVEERCLPGLRANLETCRIFTPDDFKSELNAHLGSAFSLQPTLMQSAWFRPHNRDATLGGLYFVGAGTHPGAGIPGVVGSAKATAGLIIDERSGRAGAAA